MLYIIFENNINLLINLFFSGTWMSRAFLTKNTTFKVKEDEEYAVRKKHHGKVMNFLYEYMRMHSHILNCKFYYFYVTLKPYILIKLSLIFF